MARFSAIGLLAICIAGALTAHAQTVQEAAQGLGLNTLLQALSFSPEASALVTNPAFKGVIAGPTDAALAAALAAAGAQATNPVAITETFKYHVLPNATLTNDLDTPSARGSAYNVTILSSGSDWVFLGTALNRSTTTAACAPFNNGTATLCPIDTVLVPPNATIYSYIASQPDLSILKAAIDADAALYSVTNQVDAAATVFAPTNDAFTAALTAFNLNASTLLGSKFARDTVIGHLGAGVPFKSTDAATTLETGSDVSLAVDPAAATVTVENGPVPSSASIVGLDGDAGKSIVHKISSVLTITTNTSSLTERVAPPRVPAGSATPSPVAVRSPAPTTNTTTASPAPTTNTTTTVSPAPTTTNTTVTPTPTTNTTTNGTVTPTPTTNTTTNGTIIPGIISSPVSSNRSATPGAASALYPSGLLAAALCGVAMLLMAMGTF